MTRPSLVTREPCATCARLIVNFATCLPRRLQLGYTEVARRGAGLPAGADILRDAGLTLEARG